MSVITAKVYKDRIIMAADSIMCRGWSKQTNHDFVKMEHINGMIIGGVGNAMEISLMWHYMDTHRPADATVKSVLNYVIEFSMWKNNQVGSPMVDNAYLMAYKGKLFYIEKMFIYEISDYKGIGAGEDFANAALYLGHTPKEAVETACALCCVVAEPIIEEQMPIE